MPLYWQIEGKMCLPVAFFANLFCFKDGSVFDDSRARNKPLTFLLGIGDFVPQRVASLPEHSCRALFSAGSVIKAWDDGIAQLSLGGTADVVAVVAPFPPLSHPALPRVLFFHSLHR